MERSLEDVLRRMKAQGIHTELSPVFKTPEELEAGSLLLVDMVEDARILWDRGGVLQRRLERLRDRLRQLGARRIPYGGGWYWDLKPDFRPGDVVDL